MTDNTDPRVLILAPGDNVAIAKTDIPAGATLEVAGARVTLKEKVLTGHKFAFKRLAKGEKIVKYGAPIGIATQATALVRSALTGVSRPCARSNASIAPRLSGGISASTRF